MANKTFSAVVEIGGAVKDSFRSSVKVLGGDLLGVGDAVREAKGKLDLLGNYDPQGVRKLGNEYYSLRREARKLRKEYAAADKPTKKMATQLKRAELAADKAGKAYKSSRGKLDDMGKALNKAGVKTSNLTGEHRRLSAELERSKDKMKRLNRAMEAGGKMKSQIGDAARMGAGVAAGVGVIGAAVTMANKATGEQVALAKSLSMSTDTFQAWGGVAKEAGFEIDNVGDLIEEMNNKLGESAGLEEITPVKESLEILGLSFEGLKDLKPEEQFHRIAEAIKSMPNDQKAVAAADILMGGEANKFFGYLRTRKESVEQILAQQKRLNVLSDEGRAGAAAYNTAFARMTTVVGSVASEVSGLIGGALAPLVDEYAPKLADWVTSHKQDLIGVGDAIKDAIPGFLAFARGVGTVVSGIGSIASGAASLVGGFDNLAIAVGVVFGARAAFGIGKFATDLFSVGKAVAPIVATHFPAIIGGIKAIGAAAMANPIGLVIGAVAAVAGLVWYYWEPVSEFFGNFGSMIGDAVSTGFDFVKSVFMNFSPLGFIIKHWEPIKAWVGDLFGWIGDKASAVFGGIGSAISGVAGFFGIGGNDEESSNTIPAVGDAVKKVMPVASARTESITEAMPVEVRNAGGKSSSVSNKIEIIINAASGQSVEEIAEAVMQRLEEAGRDNARLAMYDG